MAKNKNIWVGVGIILFLIIFTSQRQETKKEAGEIVKFRTNDLGYSSYSSIISFNINCDGSNLVKYKWSAAVFLTGGTSCNEKYGTPIFNESLVGNPSSNCGTPTKLYIQNPTTNAVVACCDTSDGTGRGPLYQLTTETESAISIDSSMEIFCIVLPPPTYNYQSFITAKNNYLNGGSFADFVTNANNWVQSA